MAATIVVSSTAFRKRNNSGHHVSRFGHAVSRRLSSSGKRRPANQIFSPEPGDGTARVVIYGVS
jgi:hypothetical protein